MQSMLIHPMTWPLAEGMSAYEFVTTQRISAQGGDALQGGARIHGISPCL